MTNSHQKQASRDAHTMFGVCWLHLLFCMFVVLSAAVVPRSLVVVMIVVVVVVVCHLHLHLHLRCAISLYPYILFS